MMKFKALVFILVFGLACGVACGPSRLSFKEKWLKIIPGQSTTGDVLNLLGAPNLKAEGFIGEVWCYDPPQPGQGCIEFKGDSALTKSVPIGLGTSSNLDPEITSPYTMTRLLQDYGMPSVIYERPTQSDPFGVLVTRNWTFSYPEKGFDVQLWMSPSEQQQPGAPPQPKANIGGRVFYVPMALDKYREVFSPTIDKNDQEIIDVVRYLKPVWPR
jgi:hypothetical protein